MAFTVTNGKIAQIDALLDPERLEQLDLSIPPTAGNTVDPKRLPAVLVVLRSPPFAVAEVRSDCGSRSASTSRTRRPPYRTSRRVGLEAIRLRELPEAGLPAQRTRRRASTGRARTRRSPTLSMARSATVPGFASPPHGRFAFPGDDVFAGRHQPESVERRPRDDHADGDLGERPPQRDLHRRLPNKCAAVRTAGRRRSRRSVHIQGEVALCPWSGPPDRRRPRRLDRRAGWSRADRRDHHRYPPLRAARATSDAPPETLVQARRRSSHVHERRGRYLGDRRLDLCPASVPAARLRVHERPGRVELDRARGLTSPSARRTAGAATQGPDPRERQTGNLARAFGFTGSRGSAGALLVGVGAGPTRSEREDRADSVDDDALACS